MAHNFGWALTKLKQKKQVFRKAWEIGLTLSFEENEDKPSIWVNFLGKKKTPFLMTNKDIHATDWSEVHEAFTL